jgi:proline dehydrogenase
MIDEAAMLLLNSTLMNLLNSTLAVILSLFPHWMIKPFAKPYVAGESIAEVLTHVHALNVLGFSATIDILGEHVKTTTEATAITKSYLDIMSAIFQNGLNSNISIKPTHIGLDINYDTARDNLFTLLSKANEIQSFVRIDMEDSPYTDAAIKLYLEACMKYTNVGLVIQSYLHRSSDDISRLKGEKFNVRICKGIYKEAESIAFQSKAKINENYIKLVQSILSSGGYVAIATHDLNLINELEDWIIKNEIAPDRFEFQVLFGVPMSGRLQALLAKGYSVRQYVPFGKEWHDYSIRRLKENPKIISYVLKNMFKKN